MRFLIVFAGMFFAVAFALNVYSEYAKPRISTVVIDAGHGGKDPGCVGRKSKEKDIALSIALQLGSMIEKNYPDVRVIYTRRDDRFVELFQRAEIANRNKAELFISIHCNASPSINPYGVETYVMGLNKSEANLSVAKKENSSILLEDDYKKRYDGFDPNSPEAYIIFSLFQNAYLDQSLDLASKIQKEFEDEGRFNRGVKQAGFLVLYKTTMPGMLVEAGFLSNRNEEDFLASDEGQKKITRAIFNAFRKYKNEKEGRGTVAAESIKADTKNIPKIDTSHITKPATVNERGKISYSAGSVNVKNKDSLIKNPQNVKVINTQTAGNEVLFKIQFMASPVKKDLAASVFKNIDKVSFYTEKGLYKYTAGAEIKLDDAKLLLAEIKEKGFKDAFIIAFVNGIKVKSIQEALNVNIKY